MVNGVGIIGKFDKNEEDLWRIGDFRVCENWGFRFNRIELEREKLEVKWVFELNKKEGGTWRESENGSGRCYCCCWRTVEVQG